MQELNAKLLARAQSVEQKHNLMAEHVAQMSECLKQKTRENETLQAELEAFRKSIKVGCPPPCVFEPQLQCSQAVLEAPSAVQMLPYICGWSYPWHVVRSGTIPGKHSNNSGGQSPGLCGLSALHVF